LTSGSGVGSTTTSSTFSTRGFLAAAFFFFGVSFGTSLIVVASTVFRRTYAFCLRPSLSSASVYLTTGFGFSVDGLV